MLDFRLSVVYSVVVLSPSYCTQHSLLVVAVDRARSRPRCAHHALVLTTHSRSRSRLSMPTLRSESAPRRSSRVVQAEKAATKAKDAAAAAADKASKKARPAAKKAGKVVKKTAAKAKTAVRKNVVKPAAKKVAKAAGVEVKEDNKPKATTSRKRKTDDAEADKDEKEDTKKQKKDEGASGKYTVGDVVEDVVLHNGASLLVHSGCFDASDALLGTYAEDDKEVSLKSLYDEKPLVIFSYPKVRRVDRASRSPN